MPLQQAFEQWKEIKDLEILDVNQANERYQKNTLGTSRILNGALRPKRVDQIQKIVEIANNTDVTLYAFSTGHNWGFGSSLPSVDNCVIVDLSGMKRVIEFNEDLGYVTLEPGVTQQDLRDYMVKNGHPFMVPTTGAGPTCSIVGNALERGYGLTPNIDHFGAVLGLEAVLPNGELYRSVFTEFGAKRADKIYKWKAGPYLDGLFTQSNFGIVTQGTIEILRKPDHVGQFIAFIDAKDFQGAVKSIARTKEKFGTMVGGLNIMNVHRLLAMVELKKEWHINGVVPESHIHELAKKRKLSDWAVLIGVYSPDELISPIRKALKQEFGQYTSHHVFLTKQRLWLVEKILKFFPKLGINRTIHSIDLALQILEGIPNEVALPLAYLKNPHGSPKEHFHPDKDGSGLLWFTPMLPVEGPLAEKFVKGVKKICVSEEIEPMITLTTISQRCFAANIPLVFNRDDEKQCEQARRCMQRLMRFSMDLGLFPDRLDIRTQREMFDHADAPVFRLSQKIKQAIDPKETLSPGRYMKIMNDKKH